MKQRVLRRLTAALIAACVIFACVVLASSGGRFPQTGKTVKKDSKLKVDASHTDEGYFMAATTSTKKKKYKLRVVKGDTTLTYDLTSGDDLKVFPLQLGDGTYKVSLYENVSGKSYSQAGAVSLKVSLKDPDSPFLYPNQYVSYTADSPAVKAANELCRDKSSAKQIYDAVCGYMKTSLAYDFVKAATVKAGVLPDVDGCFEKRMGICQDLSAIMVCMLRSQGVPAKLMIGYADKFYHAWVVAIVDGEEQFFDPTAQLGGIGKIKDYTVERFY